MKAILINETGPVENLLYEDVAPPVLKDNEVLIEVKAIGINPVDYKVRKLEEVLHTISGEGYPAIIGWDIAGEVASKGSAVVDFKTGDRVFGMINFPGRGRAYADYVASPENHLAHIPEEISYESAAATTLAALTAVQALRGRINSNNSVLIHAGSGGVGHFAIQLAKHMGANTITTCSAKNRDFVKALGAKVHIDYNAQAFQETLYDMDYVLDCVGTEEVLLNSIKATKVGGTIISLPSPQFSEKVLAAAKEKDIDLSFILVESSGKDMKLLKSYLEEGIIKPHVSKTFTFEEMAQAHAHLETGRTVGKVVVKK